MRLSIIAFLSLAVIQSALPQGKQRPLEPPARPAQQQTKPYATATQKLAPLDGNPTIFAVLAAINAAGYDTDIDSPTNNPLRAQLRNHLSQVDLPILPELRRFVRDHKLANPVDDLGQYISFALLSKGAPDFLPAMAGFPMPPDADRLHDFPALMEKFYQQADIATLWSLSQPAYDAALAPYTDPLARATQSVNAYLRNPLNPQTSGRFQVFVDLLGAPNQVHARTYLDEYFVVITPSPEPRAEEVRHQYLRFWSDSYGIKYAADLKKISTLGDYALSSPLLGDAYREDFVLLAIESFVRAVESRLDRKPDMATQAMREGFVLAPAFAELLPKYDAQPDNMRNYFADLIKGISPKKEMARLDKIDWATERQVKTVRVTVEVKPPPLTGNAKILEDGEEAFRTGKVAAAKEIWGRLLASTDERPVQARAYYGLGRVALAERDPERADQLLRKVLDLSPDPSTLSWTLVYLGKLSDSQGEGEMAKQFYSKALAVTGVSDQVKREAEQGLTGAFFRSRPPEAEQPEEDLEDDEDLDDLP